MKDKSYIKQSKGMRIGSQTYMHNTVDIHEVV